MERFQVFDVLHHEYLSLVSLTLAQPDALQELFEQLEEKEIKIKFLVAHHENDGVEVSGFFFGVAPQPNDGVLHMTLNWIHAVLMFPLGHVATSLGPGIRFLGWPLMVLNSLMWALAIYFLFKRLRATH